MWNNRERKKFVDDRSVDVKPNIKSAYPFRLNFYDIPPLYEVSLEEFETSALDRLRILAEIESSFARNRPWEELRSVTEKMCDKYLPLNTNKATTIDLDAQRRKDHLGHFVLRLAFCRSEDLRRRFMKTELTLFRVRYDTDDTTERNAFIATRPSDWLSVDESEKDQYEAELESLIPNTLKLSPEQLKQQFKKEQYWKVRWTKVPDLVEKRRVFLRGGWAYVPSREQSSIVFQEFETQLRKALELTAKVLPRLDEDSRLVPILNNLSRGFVAGVPSEWSQSIDSGDELRASMIDDLSKKHFPMCMRNLHDSLMRDRHLKHFGRLQYGLFLKILGLSIDEAIVFWRKAFNGVTDDKFNKEYKYNIRHSYGLEGKRANYPAKSCQQIIMGDKPGPSDCHGCPYHHFAPENLQSALLSTYSSQGLTAADLPEIMSTVQKGHFNVACTRVFEITHTSKGIKKGDGIGGGESVTHPNQYAAKSRELDKTPASDTAMVVD